MQATLLNTTNNNSFLEAAVSLSSAWSTPCFEKSDESCASALLQQSYLKTIVSVGEETGAKWTIKKKKSAQ